MLDRRDRRLWQKATGATLCALGLWAGSCRREQTSILIVVNSDFAVTSELNEIQVRVTPSAPDASSNELNFTLAPAGDPRCAQRNSGVHCLPLSFAIEPNPSRPAGVPTRVEIIGVHAGAPVVKRAAVLSFRTGSSLAYGMFLPRECAIANNRCAGAGLTCTENGCAPERVPDEQLVTYSQGNEQGLARPPGDGGAFADSGMDASELTDATDAMDATDATDATDANGTTAPYTLSVGNSHACALHRRTGRVFCWGANDVGELGRGFVTPVDDGVGGNPTAVEPLPPDADAGAVAPTYIAIAAGRGSTCAITDRNELYCWGDPNEILIDRDPANITRPKRVTDAPRSRTGSMMRSISSICGAYFIQFADGTVASFGSRYASATADGAENNGAGPVRYPGEPPLPTLANTRYMANGHSATGVVVDGDGNALGWGDPNHFVLGSLTGTAIEGTRRAVTTPMAIPGATSLVAAQVGSTATVGLRATGEVLTWGNNEGALIDDRIDAGINYATPTVRDGLPPNVRRIAMSDATAFALTDTDELWCFGARYNDTCPSGGRPGTPRQMTPFSAPTRRIVEVHAGFHFACALSEDGYVACWGSNQWSQCGAAPSAPISPNAANTFQLPAL